MGEPLSSDRVFDFPMDERESHPTYDLFALGSLPGYADNSNNNRWIEEDVPLVGELGAEVDELMIDPVINEVALPIAEGEEQLIAIMIDVEEDIAMLFDDDDLMMTILKDSRMMRSTYEVGGPSTASAEGQSFTLLAPGFPIPSLVIEDLSMRMDGITIGEIGTMVSTVEERVQVMASQMVQVVGRLEQVGTQVEQGQKTATQSGKAIAGLSQQEQTL
nr:hypothetical protein [Tanacetum cinerariifolium]